MSRIYRVHSDHELHEKQLPCDIFLEANDSHHLKNVLRLKNGTPLEIFDGRGKSFEGLLVEIQKQKVRIRVMQVLKRQEEGFFEISVFQAPPGGSRMDQVIRPLAELGAKALRPLLTEFTLAARYKKSKKFSKNSPKNFPKNFFDNRLGRWQRMARESAKQSGRPTPMAVGSAITFEEALSGLSGEERVFDYGFLLSPEPSLERVPLWQEILKKNFQKKTKKTMTEPLRIVLLIGPEGGFSSSEIRKAQSAGFFPLSIGPFTLRSETAGPAAMAICQYVLSLFSNSLGME